MRHYTNNHHWLLWFAPFKALSISAAYLTPFFIENGLTMAEIFALQAIFSIAVVAFELPSGYLADRVGHARTIKFSAPVAGLAMFAYGFSTDYWQFVICEVLLAFATALISGADTALLAESLRASGRRGDFVAVSRRIESYGFAAVAIGVPVSMALVTWVSIRSTLVADGILTFVGTLFVLRLVEVPMQLREVTAERPSALREVLGMVRAADIRWLVILSATLSAATYLGFWLTVPYYQAMGIPVVWFAAILAGRSLWKAWLSHHFARRAHGFGSLVWFAVTATGVYLAMATQQLWLAAFVLGHDVVQALARQPIADQLNERFTSALRATLNSASNLFNRLAFSIAGPFVGLAVDELGLTAALCLTGGAVGLIAAVALARLGAMGTFQERR